MMSNFSIGRALWAATRGSLLLTGLCAILASITHSSILNEMWKLALALFVAGLIVDFVDQFLSRRRKTLDSRGG